MKFCGYNNHQAVMVNEQRFEQYLTTCQKKTIGIHLLSFSSSQETIYIVFKTHVTLQLYTIKWSAVSNCYRAQ